MEAAAAETARLRLQVLAFSLTRLVLFTAFRMVFPFLPEAARGLGVGLEVAALAVAARSALGLAGPVLGSIADARGRRWAILLGLATFSAGMVLIALSPTYPSFLAGLLLSYAGEITFEAAMYAYLADRVPYERRGRALAPIEGTFSVAFLVGIPVVGWLTARSGWNAPYGWLAAAGAAAAVMLRLLLPRDRLSPRGQPSLAAGLRRILSRRPAVAGMVVCLLFVSGIQSINIIYGAWLEQAFGLGPEALGLASTVIGAAGLAGVGLVALLTDRIGKRRAVAIGLIANVLAGLGLLALGKTLAGALILLFLFYLSFEFIIVSMLSLMSQFVPEARATMMAATLAAISGGDALGAAVGPLLFRGGLGLSALAAAALDLAALAVLWRWIPKDPEAKS